MNYSRTVLRYFMVSILVSMLLSTSFAKSSDFGLDLDQKVRIFLEGLDNSLKDRIDQATGNLDVILTTKLMNLEGFINNLRYALRNDLNETIGQLDRSAINLLREVSDIIQNETYKTMDKIESIEDRFEIKFDDYCNRLPDWLCEDKYLINKVRGALLSYKSTGTYDISFNGTAVFDMIQVSAILYSDSAKGPHDIRKYSKKNFRGYRQGRKTLSIPVQDINYIFKNTDPVWIGLKLICKRKIKKKLRRDAVEEYVFKYKLLLEPKYPAYYELFLESPPLEEKDSLTRPKYYDVPSGKDIEVFSRAIPDGAVLNLEGSYWSDIHQLDYTTPAPVVIAGRLAVIDEAWRIKYCPNLTYKGCNSCNNDPKCRVIYHADERLAQAINQFEIDWYKKWTNSKPPANGSALEIEYSYWNGPLKPVGKNPNQLVRTYSNRTSKTIKAFIQAAYRTTSEDEGRPVKTPLYLVNPNPESDDKLKVINGKQYIRFDQDYTTEYIEYKKMDQYTLRLKFYYDSYVTEITETSANIPRTISFQTRPNTKKTLGRFGLKLRPYGYNPK